MTPVVRVAPQPSAAAPGTGPTATHTVEVRDDIRQVPAHDWDALLGPDDVQASHRFVLACQTAAVENAQYRHVIVRDSAGVLCTSSYSGFGVRLELLAPRAVRGAVAGVRRLQPHFLYPSLVIGGLPVSFNQSCLRFRTDAPVPTLLGYIEPVIEELAAAVAASIVCLKEYDDAEADRLAPVAALGYTHAWSLPACMLPLRWHAFGDYIAELRSSYRHQVTAALRTGRAAGLRARLVQGNASDACAALFPLYNQVMDRAEYQMERLNARFFEEIGQLPEVEVLLMERAGRVVAGAILLRGQRRGTFLIAGIDYERNRECQAYINLLTRIVEWGIDSGFSELELGQTSYPLKTRFGADLQSRHLFFRHRGALGRKLLPQALPFLFPAHSFPLRRIFKQTRHAQARRPLRMWSGIAAQD